IAANCPEPFRDLNDTNFVRHVCSGGRETIPDNTPPDFRQWIERCWHQNPTVRPRAVEMVHFELEGIETLARDGNTMIDSSIPSDQENKVVPPSSLEAESDTSSTMSRVQASAPISSTPPVYCFDNEVGVPAEPAPATTAKDEETRLAIQCLGRAAELSEPVALATLARLYEHGEAGLQKDDRLALSYYSRAAKAGNPTAMMWMAKAYASQGDANSMANGKLSQTKAEQWFAVASQ
ncbi:hypothetical protein DFQ27_000600, partial [Actinomortierella ambigua]